MLLVINGMTDKALSSKNCTETVRFDDTGKLIRELSIEVEETIDTIVSMLDSVTTISSIEIFDDTTSVFSSDVYNTLTSISRSFSSISKSNYAFMMFVKKDN